MRLLITNNISILGKITKIKIQIRKSKGRLLQIEIHGKIKTILNIKPMKMKIKIKIERRK